MRVAVAVLLAFGAGLGLGLLVREGSTTTRAARAPSGSEPFRAVDSTPEAPEPIQAPRGDGVIRGRVLTDDLDAMEGVLIVAVPNRPPVSAWQSRAPAGPQEDMFLAESIAEARWSLATRRETRTDPDGHYVLRGLADRVHEVRAFREAYELRTHGTSNSAVRPDAEVDFRGTRLVRVEIVVRGAPDSVGRMLFVRGEKHSTGRFWEERDRWYELEPGFYTFTAQAGLKAEYQSEPREIEILDAKDQRIELELVGKPSLTGRVTFAEGYAPQRQTFVYCVPATGGASALSAMSRLTGKHPVTVEAGRYWFTGLEPGAYFVAVGFGTDRLEPAQRVLVSGVTTHDIVVAAPDPAECVTIRALGPNGANLRNCSADSIIRHPNMELSGGAQTFRRPDGTLTLRLPVWNAEQWGQLDERVRYFVEATVPELGAIRRPCEPGGSIEFHFREPARIRAVVEGFAECDRAESLRLTFRQGERVLQWSVPLDVDGAATLDKLQPGELLVSLSEESSPPLLDQIVELKSGDNEVRLRIPQMFPFTAEVPGESAGQVWVAVRTRGTYRAPLDSEGIARFRLPAGEYVVGFGTRESVTVRVPATVTATVR